MQPFQNFSCHKKNKIMRLLFLILTIVTICSSCRKPNKQTGGNLEIYLFKTFQLVSGKCQVNGDSSVLKDTAIVKNNEILFYSSANYQFTLTENSIQKIRALHSGIPFAIVIDKQVIYYGIIKTITSSSSCTSSITMNYSLGDNKITMNLGYAGTDLNIDDQRNNSKLIATLKNQGKLR